MSHPTLDPDDSDFLALQSLVWSAKTRPVNIGWWVAKAYWLGKGEPIDFVMEEPPKTEPDVVLKLVGSEPDESTANDEQRTDCNG
jgi:hypothetical protein